MTKRLKVVRRRPHVREHRLGHRRARLVRVLILIRVLVPVLVLVLVLVPVRARGGAGEHLRRRREALLDALVEPLELEQPPVPLGLRLTHRLVHQVLRVGPGGSAVLPHEDRVAAADHEERLSIRREGELCDHVGSSDERLARARSTPARLLRPGAALAHGGHRPHAQLLVMAAGGHVRTRACQGERVDGRRVRVRQHGRFGGRQPTCGQRHAKQGPLERRQEERAAWPHGHRRRVRREGEGIEDCERARVEGEHRLILKPPSDEQLVVRGEGEARLRVRERLGRKRARGLVRVHHIVRGEAAVRTSRVEPLAVGGVGEVNDLPRMLRILLEERRGRDVEDTHRSIVEAGGDDVLRRVVRDTARASFGQLELDQLRLRTVELPHADRAVAGGGDELAVMRVEREPIDDVRVRAHDGCMLERGHVEHPNRARGCTDEELQPIRRRVNCRYAPFVLSLQKVRRKVERPHA